MVNLSEIEVGQQVEIIDFENTSIKCYSARLGIEKGQVVTCIAKPGPVVIKKNNQEIAIGKVLSRQIYIKII